MTDHTTLAAWLPLLQHPEVGERVCKAAGIELYKGSFMSGDRCIDADSPVTDPSAYWTGSLPQTELAALAFGTLAVLADENQATNLRGLVMHHPSDLPDYPAAVLAAALRVWGEKIPDTP